MKERDVKKIIELIQHKVNKNYTLCIGEVKQLRALSVTDDLQESYLNLIANSYYYGYAMGTRAEHKLQKEKSSVDAGNIKQSNGE